MFILFNDCMLNTANVIGFRRGPVTKEGKYPLIADLIANTGASPFYIELYKDEDSRQEKLSYLMKILLAQLLQLQTIPPE